MIFLDAHVHFYAEYKADLLFDSFIAHAEAYAPRGSGLAMSVMLRDFQPSLESAVGSASPSKWRLSRDGRDGMALKATDGLREIALFPARQVAAAERVELLGFFGESSVPDGLPLSETATRLRSAGFVPVIAWGKGKWLFGRRALVRNLMAAEASASPLPFIGDSALRPFFWPESLFSHAAGLGMRLTYGSDPLPGAGNETKAGGYATLVDADLDCSFAGMLKALSTASLRSCGKRASH